MSKIGGNIYKTNCCVGLHLDFISAENDEIREGRAVFRFRVKNTIFCVGVIANLVCQQLTLILSMLKPELCEFFSRLSFVARSPS